MTPAADGRFYAANEDILNFLFAGAAVSISLRFSKVLVIHLG